MWISIIPCLIKRWLHKTFGSIIGCAPLPHCVSQFHDLDFLTAPTDPYVLCLHYLGKLYSSHSNPCTYLFMYITQGVLIQGAYNFFNFKTIHFIFSSGNGILLPKLFWPNVRKKCSKAITSVGRPKMKRDAGVKAVFLLRKKTAFTPASNNCFSLHQNNFGNKIPF